VADDAQRLTALTTEHFGLAGARSQAAGESASRSALFLGSVSSALIGLGLTAQVSSGGTLFRVFEHAGDTGRYFMLSGNDDAVGGAIRFQRSRREAGTLHAVLFPSGTPVP
jgi:hypothetical protein